MPSARKALARIPHRDAMSLISKLRAVAADPFGNHPAATRLAGSEDYRLRQGDWRALYRIDRVDNVLVVDAIAHRREVYRQ